MSAEGLPRPVSAAEYFAYEQRSETKHEYINGQVYEMAGASDAHVTISGNVFAILRGALRGSGCRAFIADMRVHVEAVRSFYYPDVFVTCDRRDGDNHQFKRHPRLIIEVLSDSTEAFDRGIKFAHYRTIDPLMEYVLIAQDRVSVEVFRRMDTGEWRFVSYSPRSSVWLESIKLEAPIEALYEDVVVLPMPTDPRQFEDGENDAPNEGQGDNRGH